MRANKCFLIRLPNWFSMCLDSNKKILPLYYKHVIEMSSRKIRGKFHQLVFSEVNNLVIKAATGNIKTRTIRNFLFSLTLQAVRLNNQGAPLLGLAKFIY